MSVWVYGIWVYGIWVYGIWVYGYMSIWVYNKWIIKWEMSNKMKNECMRVI